MDYFIYSIKKYDVRQITLSPKGENIDGIEKISEAFANVVNMNDNHGMASSTLSLPSGDVMEDDVVHLPSETDIRELNVTFLLSLAIATTK